jgi:hypothetical protein
LKFVRWLNAYRRYSTLEEAVGWELTQSERQIATEPLWRSCSMLHSSQIGLVIDHEKSIFVKAWFFDATTVSDENGILRKTKKGRDFRNMNKFLSAWNRKNPGSERDGWHGEVVFDKPVFSGVALMVKTTRNVRKIAEEISVQTGLPVRFVNYAG